MNLIPLQLNDCERMKEDSVPWIW